MNKQDAFDKAYTEGWCPAKLSDTDDPEFTALLHHAVRTTHVHFYRGRSGRTVPTTFTDDGNQAEERSFTTRMHELAMYEGLDIPDIPKGVRTDDE